MTAPKLEMRNLYKSFPRGNEEIPVVEDFSITIPNLEFIAIIGPSGCGKSTWLRLIDGLIPSDSGSICIHEFYCQFSNISLRWGLRRICRIKV